MERWIYLLFVSEWAFFCKNWKPCPGYPQFTKYLQLWVSSDISLVLGSVHVAASRMFVREFRLMMALGTTGWTKWDVKRGKPRPAWLWHEPPWLMFTECSFWSQSCHRAKIRWLQPPGIIAPERKKRLGHYFWKVWNISGTSTSEPSNLNLESFDGLLPAAVCSHILLRGVSMGHAQEVITAPLTEFSPSVMVWKYSLPL